MPQTSPIHPHHQQKLPQQHQWRLHQHSSGALALERVGELPPPSARRHGKQTDKSPIAELGSLIGEKVGDFIRYQQTAGMGSNPRGHSFRGHHGGQQHVLPAELLRLATAGLRRIESSLRQHRELAHATSARADEGLVRRDQVGIS